MIICKAKLLLMFIIICIDNLATNIEMIINLCIMSFDYGILLIHLINPWALDHVGGQLHKSG